MPNEDPPVLRHYSTHSLLVPRARRKAVMWGTFLIEQDVVQYCSKVLPCLSEQCIATGMRQGILPHCAHEKDSLMVRGQPGHRSNRMARNLPSGNCPARSRHNAIGWNCGRGLPCVDIILLRNGRTVRRWSPVLKYTLPHREFSDVLPGASPVQQIIVIGKVLCRTTL